VEFQSLHRDVEPLMTWPGNDPLPTDPSGFPYPDNPPPMGGGGAPESGPKDPMDLPCPPGQCKDVVSMICREPQGFEKVNMTDEWERPTGGGRGYCRKRDGGGGGGGGGGFGGGGGGAGGGGGSPHGGSGGGGSTSGGPGSVFENPLSGVGGDVDKMIQGFLSGVIQGGQTRYSPEVMQDLYAGEKRTTEAQVANDTQGVNEDLAARGLYRSPVGADIAADVRRSGDARFSEGTRNIRIEKAKQDFEDRLSAVDRAQKNIDQLRSYLAQLDMTQAEREKLKATIELGYARIDAEMKMLMKQLASNKELLGMSLKSQEMIARWGIDSSEWKFLLGQQYGM
jgi:hypothetical protein